MQESSNVKTQNLRTPNSINNVMKFLNISLLIFIAIIIVKVTVFSGAEIVIGLRIFASLVFLAFMVPYILSLRAFSSAPKYRKSAIYTSIAWGVFIIAGALAQEHDFLTYVICVIFILVSIGNVFFLKKFGHSEIA